MRVTATHSRKDALDLLAREVAPAGTSWSPGTTGSGGGRASVSPSIRQFAFLLPKAKLMPAVTLHGNTFNVLQPGGLAEPITSQRIDSVPTDGEKIETSDPIDVPLIQLAFARSGDKGDTSNIGVIARRPEWLPIIRAQLTEAAVAKYLAHLVKGPITRFEVPGIHAFNFVCEQALGGGGMASLRNDPLGKGMAQILLSMPMRVSRALRGVSPS